MKEKPLIDAVSRLGPLPGFLFANSFFAGVVAALMSAVFGAVFVLFWALAGAETAPLTLFNVMRWGAAAGLAFCTLILVGIGVSGFLVRDEFRTRSLFALGGLSGVGALAAADYIFVDAVRAWLGTLGPII